MSSKKLVHDVLKLLPEDVPPFSIVGSGAYGVCIDTHSKKRKVQNAYKSFKLVTLLTTERTKQDMEKISEIKKTLYHKGVHVALSDHIEQLNCDPEGTNPYLMQAMINYKGLYYSPYEEINQAILYKEAYVKGKPFTIKEEEEYKLAALIPQHHITKLIFDSYQIVSHGLNIDTKGDNLLYSAKNGFYFIDLGLKENNKPLPIIASVITYLCGVSEFKLDNCSKDNLAYLLEYASKFDKAIDLLCKVYPVINSDMWFYNWRYLIKQTLNIRKINDDYEKKVIEADNFEQ